LYLAFYSLLRSLTVVPLSDADSALTLMVPALPFIARIITRQYPLKASRLCEGNGRKSAGFPLSVATISPGPSTLNLIWFFARGAVSPFLSVICMVMKAISLLSALILLLSDDASTRIPAL
jgi:hypothetical protein